MGMSHSDAIPPDRQSDQPDVEAVIETGIHEDMVGEGSRFDRETDEELQEALSIGPDEMSFIQAMLGHIDSTPTLGPDIGFEDVLSEATDVLDQAAAEQEMYQILVDCDAQGPEWELVVERIAQYANEVLDVWVRTGAIYGKLSAYVITVEASYSERFSLAVNEDMREEVLADTIANALVKLQKGIRERKGWNPTLGAKLTTYFLRGCLYEFKSGFEKQLRRDSDLREPLEPDEPEDIDAPPIYSSLCNTGLGTDPADIVSDHDLIQRHLAQLDEYERRIVWAKAAGYTHPEIAKLFPHKTAKAIERKLARLSADHQWIANLNTRRAR